jgi:hypothetical protein
MGIKIPDEDMVRLNISLHELYRKWNYSLEPRTTIQ